MLETPDFKTIFLNRLGPNNKEQKKVEDLILSALNQLNEDDVRNIPPPAFDVFVSLLLAKEIAYSQIKETDIEKKKFQENTQKMFKSLISFYRDDKKGFSVDNEKTLLEMFKIDMDEFTAEIKKKKGMEKHLQKGLKNNNNKFLGNEQFQASHLLEELHEALERENSEIKRIEKNHLEFRHECIIKLLTQTEFFDYLIDKKHPMTINFLTNFFKDNPDDLYAFLESKNTYLTRTNTKYTKEPKGFVHVFENTLFATAIRERIPSSLWTQSLMLSLGSNALHKDSHITVMEDFIRTLEELPSDKLQKISKPFFEMINKIFLGTNETKGTFDLKNLKAFLTTSKTKTLQELSLKFFNHLNDYEFYQIIKDLKENEVHHICRLLIKSPNNRKKLLNLTKQNNKNIIWEAFEKRGLTPKDMELLITEAISQNNTAFLFAHKDITLTRDLPAYNLLCSYFKDSIQALRFINSFQLTTKTKDAYLELVRDFITRPKMIFKIAGMNLVIHHLAQEDSDEKLLGFFFDGDIKNRQNLTLKMSIAQAKELLLKQDKDGKTPWHYLCLKRNRLFLGKNIKVLHPLLLECCYIKDNDGKTPLDYVKDDFKFRKILAEKIPALEKLMTESGLSLTYVPKQKEIKEEEKATPKPEILPQKTEDKKQVWKIEEMGHDKLRKDDFFQALLKREIDCLPQPNCGSVNVANRRLQKKEVFGAPVFKIWYENKRWRVPFIKDDETKTLFIFPASDRNDTYTNQDYCRIVRNRVKWLKRHIDHIKS